MGPVRCYRTNWRWSVYVWGFRWSLHPNFEHNFPQILRRQILLEKNNPKDQFFGQELNLASDFTRMAAWMMLQQPSKFSLIFRKFDTLQTEMNKQLDVVSSDDAEFINDVRYGQLKRWCICSTNSGWIYRILDATVAIRSELDPILAKIADKARQDVTYLCIQLEILWLNWRLNCQSLMVVFIRIEFCLLVVQVWSASRPVTPAKSYFSLLRLES